MAKAIVFEGCPTCGGYSGFDFKNMGGYVIDTVKGGALGAGSFIAADVVLGKVLSSLSPLIRTGIIGAATIAAAYMIKNKNPHIAAGLAIGGSSIALYKFIASLAAKFLHLPLPEYKGIEEEEELYLPEPAVEEEIPEEEIPEEVEVVNPYGVIVPEVEEEGEEPYGLIVPETNEEEAIVVE